MFLDLRKPFDTVNHNILFIKLNRYEIIGLPLQLIESYLTNGKHIVIHNTRSNTKQVTIDVLQGSLSRAIIIPHIY